MNENHLKAHGPGYEHVHEVFPMSIPTQDSYHLIRYLEPGGGGDGRGGKAGHALGSPEMPCADKPDLVSGLTVAYDSLCSSHKGLAYNRILCILTDACGQFCEDEEDFQLLDQVIGMLHDLASCCYGSLFYLAFSPRMVLSLTYPFFFIISFP